MPVNAIEEMMAGANNTAKYASNDNKVTDDFSRILGHKMETADETMKKMDEQREQQQSLAKQQQAVEIIRHIMPDGSVLITRYEGNNIVSSERVSPHMQVVVDTSKPVPKDEYGMPISYIANTKVVAKANTMDDLFNM